MRKWWIALVAVLAVSVGVAWGENQNGKTNAGCPQGPDCCTKSCPK